MKAVTLDQSLLKDTKSGESNHSQPHLNWWGFYSPITPKTMSSKKSGQDSEKYQAKQYARKFEETFLKRINHRMPLSLLLKTKQTYAHLEQYRDFLITVAAHGKREIITNRDLAKLGDLFIDKTGKLECFIGYKWLTISDVNNKTFEPETELLHKLETYKIKQLFVGKKYKLPQFVCKILRHKASELDSLAGKPCRPAKQNQNKGYYCKLQEIFRHSQLIIFEEYNQKLGELNKPEHRKIFAPKMIQFCFLQVEKYFNNEKQTLHNKKLINKQEHQNLIVSEKYKPKLPQIENKNYTKTESAFLFKYISPQGYYAWHKLAKAYIEKSRSYNSTKLFQVFSAPAYYVTKELLNAFLNTPVSNLKLESRPEIINNQFFLLQSLDINEVAYSYIDASATKQQRNDLSYDIVIKSYFNIDKNECRFNRKTGITLPKYINRTKLNSIKFNWSNLNKITTCKGVLPFDYLTTVEKEQFLIVVNLILFMNQEPDISVQYVSPSVITRPQKNSIEKDTFKPRDITWVGKEFTQRTLKVATNNEIDIIKEGSRPMRSHWRRGHWHTVLQGVKRQQRKMKWYQPIFVRGNKL